MERIELSQSEKIALRAIAENNADNKFLQEFSGAVDSLCRKDLVQAFGEEGHTPVDVRLTPQGRFYLNEHPKLRNKVNWAMVGAVAGLVAAVSAVAGVIVGIVACSRIF